MRAKEFVKKFGWKESMKQIKQPTGIYGAAFDYEFMGDLKTLVDAYELVESYGGMDRANDFLSICAEWIKPSLSKAIALVESCTSNN